LKYLDKIKSLLDFIRLGERSLDEITQFVVLNTLFNFSPTAMVIDVVRVDGTVQIISSFGFDQHLLATIPDRFVSADTPFNRSLRTGEIVECGNFESYLWASPGNPELFFPQGFAYSVAWPIPGLGSAVTYCSKENELTVESREFLLIIGMILSLQTTYSRIGSDFGRFRASHVPPYDLALTNRQWTILEAIKTGRTNFDIAEDLGFSESLIRQETVQIYRKLGVTGRKEILESELDHGVQDVPPPSV
jgi:DNA-binding CsgD family transcriptional regulator